MKLTYYTDSPNFGDRLNPLVFQHFLPDFFDDDETVQFLGIGSTIGILHPGSRTRRQIVFSSGFAYGAIPGDLSRHEFVCVRGPETARVLGIAPELAIADGALLLRHMPFPSVEKRYRASFMPHEYGHVHYPAWREIARGCGLHYIDPHAPVEKVLEEIRSSRLLLAEAMHGAIVADVFRVPWIPLRLNPRTNLFKWKDYTRSLELSVEPVQLPELNSREEWIRKFAFQMNKRFAKGTPLAPFLATLYESSLSPLRRRSVMRRLNRMQGLTGCLSAEGVLDRKAGELLQSLNGIASANSTG